MEQHPIPQQISSYEFKLVGEMTLKQFLKAAGGIILALLINSTKLVFFVKWPLMLVFGAGGLALAFLPFQDRPLETWVKAFIRSIYSPTIFVYKKVSSKNWLDLDPSKAVALPKEEEEEEAVKPLPTKENEKVKEFIGSLPSVKREIGKEEKSEQPTVNSKIEPEKVVVETTKATVAETVAEKDWRSEKVDLKLKTEKLEATGEAKFGSIPMPDIPEIANTIVGMVLDTNGKIVEGAIVEVQDEKGNPSRVFKTNSLGQFKTATPLASGKYLVVAEKDNLSFDRVNIDLKGKIVEPIRITATG